MAVAKRIIFINILISGCFLLFTFSVYSATIRVPSDQPTIPDGINAAVDGDTVLVSDGVYPGENNVISKRIFLVSENGPRATIIEGGLRAYRIQAKVTIEGFQFRNGTGTIGSLWILHDSVTVKNCFIVETDGIPITGYGVEITNCLFRDNINSQIVFANSASSGTVSGCTFFGNTATAGQATIVIGSDNEVTLRNNTIIRNKQPSILAYSDAIVDISNTIIAFNKNGSVIECRSTTTINIECSNLFGNEGGDWNDCLVGDSGINGNFSADPRTCDSILGDYHLLEDSPCHPDSSACGLIGALGVGCGEGFYIAPIVISIGFSPLLEDFVASRFPTFTWITYGAVSGNQTQYEIEIGADISGTNFDIWSSGVVNSSDTETTYTGPALGEWSNYKMRIRLNDGTGFGSWRNYKFTTYVPVIRNVPSDYQTIQDAISASKGFDTILVADGIYSGQGNINVRVRASKNLIIRSENGPATTIIDCQRNGRGFEFQFDRDSTVVLDGFTIRNGYVEGAGGAILANRGGFPTILNCVFVNNEANYGGAMYFNGIGVSIPIARLRNLTFYNNSAKLGGAIYYQNSIEEITIENSIFVRNVSTEGGPPVETYLTDPAKAKFSCTNLYNNSDGDWIGKISDQENVNGNLSANPMFCDASNGIYTLDSLSPCLAGHPLNFCNSLIGALGAGCSNCGSDVDSDAICDGGDNCVGVSNPDQADTDNDGIGDACCCTGNRGDFNGDGNDANILDLTFLVDYIFRGGDMAGCPNEADINSDSGSGNILDLTYLVDFIFRGGEAAPACP